MLETLKSFDDILQEEQKTLAHKISAVVSIMLKMHINANFPHANALYIYRIKTITQSKI